MLKSSPSQQYAMPDPWHRLQGSHLQKLGEFFIWQRKVDGIKRTFKAATKYCQDLELNGIKNWELPSYEHIQAITKKKNLFDPFKINGIYWSSSEVVKDGKYAWRVFFSDGSKDYKDKRNLFNVRCYRSFY